jgi:hypothetical protein
VDAVVEAFARALAEHAGVIVGVAVALLVEVGRRFAHVRVARAAVAQYGGDERTAAEHVARMPRALRPLREKNVRADKTPVDDP